MKAEDLKRESARAGGEIQATKTRLERLTLEKDSELEVRGPTGKEIGRKTPVQNERRRLSSRIRDLEEERGRRCGLLPSSSAVFVHSLTDAKETLQEELRDAQAQLRRAAAELDNLEKVSHGPDWQTRESGRCLESEASKDAALERWESSYREAVHTIEALRSDNTSLGDQLRRLTASLEAESTRHDYVRGLPKFQPLQGRSKRSSLRGMSWPRSWRRWHPRRRRCGRRRRWSGTWMGSCAKPEPTRRR